jgi:glycerol-3-phosphate dehydrogenase
MKTIPRNTELASKQLFDVIIVGGGVYGVSLALMASLKGLTNLLVEKNDFGWSTTFNHLRTVHGGLRYLQSLDFPRFFESVSERHWFLQSFPGLVKPLPCLMPLYGNGPYRPSVFKVALGLNDFLSRNRNRHVPAGQELQNGQVISPEQVIQHFPLVDRDGLKGGAIWYDGGMPHAQLVIIEMLKRACEEKTTALNYTQAEELIVADNCVQGLRCRDRESGLLHEFKSERVINAAGPWSRSFAASFHDDDPNLFRYSIAWNVLFNKKALSNHSVAVKPKRPGSRMYFIHGFNNLIMGGTIHAPWPGVCDTPLPDRRDVAAYIDDLNLSVPGLHLQQSDILQVYAGLLPVQKQGTDKLAVREIIKDHGATGGPRGAYSVSGVKLTTARLVADKVLKQVFPDRTLKITRKLSEPLPSQDLTLSPDPIFSFDWHPEKDNQDWQERLRAIIANQSVMHLDDLIVRRTTIGDNPSRALAAAPRIAALFDWDEQRRTEEQLRLESFFAGRSLSSPTFQQTPKPD